MTKGDCPISSLERALDCEIEVPEDEPVEIVTNLILNKLKRMPVENEKIDFKEFKAVIKKMNGPRIMKVKIYPKAKPREDDDIIFQKKDTKDE